MTASGYAGRERPLVGAPIRILNAFDGARVRVGGTFRVPGGAPRATGRLIALYAKRTRPDGREIYPADIEVDGAVQRVPLLVRDHKMFLNRACRARGWPVLWRWQDVVIPT